MLLVLAMIVVSTGIGVYAERRDPEWALRAAAIVVRGIVWVLMPFVLLMVGPRIAFGDGLGVGIGLAFVELACVAGLAFLISDRLLRLPRPVTGSVTCAVMLANTGYLGVPLSSTLLGHESITDAVAWDAVVSNTMLFGPAFAVGAALGTTAGESPRERTVAFFTRNPVLYALLIGLLAPRSWSPEAAFDVAKFIISFGVLPLGFFLLGVHLMEEQQEDLPGRLRLPPFTQAVGLVCGLRLLAAPALLAVLVVAVGVTVPDAFYLQAAMPSGVNTLVVAHVFGLDLRTAAGAIAWSTVLAIIAAIGLSFVL
jgi:predicted permease